MPDAVVPVTTKPTPVGPSPSPNPAGPIGAPRMAPRDPLPPRTAPSGKPAPKSDGEFTISIPTYIGNTGLHVPRIHAVGDTVRVTTEIKTAAGPIKPGQYKVVEYPDPYHCIIYDGKIQHNVSLSNFNRSTAPKAP